MCLSFKKTLGFLSQPYLNLPLFYYSVTCLCILYSCIPQFNLEERREQDALLRFFSLTFFFIKVTLYL